MSTAESSTGDMSTLGSAAGSQSNSFIGAMGALSATGGMEEALLLGSSATGVCGKMMSNPTDVTLFTMTSRSHIQSPFSLVAGLPWSRRVFGGTKIWTFTQHRCNSEVISLPPTPHLPILSCSWNAFYLELTL